MALDMKSFLYLAGTELDFSDGLNGKGFAISTTLTPAVPAVAAKVSRYKSVAGVSRGRRSKPMFV
jgi:hypothetical protein